MGFRHVIEVSAAACPTLKSASAQRRGRRPSFDRAMAPEAALELFRHFPEQLRTQPPGVQPSFFQGHMEVELVNDGPVTFILER